MAYSPHIIYEDNHLIAVNKPFGMPSQADASNDLNVFDWVGNYIKEKYQKPGNVYVGLLHRLDRPVGGIILLAKTSKAASRLSEQFKQRKVQKTYLAVTERAPSPDSGELIHFLKKIAGKNIMRAYVKEIAHSKEAKLHYKTKQIIGQHALVEVKPLTGRRHQIRVQLASIGCVICGDVKYGKTTFLPDKSIALLAHSLEFIHPTKKELVSLNIHLPNTEIWRHFSI